MVEKMKKIRLLMATVDASGILADLQNLGVLHIESGTVAQDNDISGLTSQINDYRKTLGILAAFANNIPAEDVETLENPQEYLSLVKKMLEERDRLTTSLQWNAKELTRLEYWGTYEPELVKALGEAGLVLSFHVLSTAVFDDLDTTGHFVEVIRREKSQVHFVQVRYADDAGHLSDTLIPEERLGDISTAKLHQQLEDFQSKIQQLNIKLQGLAAHAYILSDALLEMESERERRIAALSLDPQAEGAASCLTGYVPVSLLSNLESFLEDRSIVSLIEDSDEPHKTPTRLKNGPAAGLFEPITEIFGLPQYAEIDTTPFFAPFFAFFFGMCLADVGYGFVVMLGALVGMFTLKKKALRSLAVLGFLLGVMTVIGGILLNSVFGIKVDGLPSVSPEVKSLLLFSNINDAMAFSILLGITQILFGYLIQMANKWRQESFLAVLRPLGTFLFIVGIGIWAIGILGPEFAIGPIPLGAWISSLGNTRDLGLGIMAAGILFILLFNNLSKKFWIRPLSGLWEMYNIVTGLPGDILSYIRLFALGLAGSLLGGAINLIAMMIRGENPNLFSWFFVFVVLLAGHSINFALAALGAFVHPLRLTFVEFYKSVGFEGEGHPYAPYGGKTS